MRHLINHWYDFNIILAIAIIIFIIAEKINLDFQQRLVLFEFAFLNVHFGEEYGHPGDMPGTLNVSLYHNPQSPTIYPFNQISAIICNYLWGIMVWLVPVLIPKQTWLTMAAVIGGILEFGLHLFYYPRKNGASLSSGIVTAMLGFLPCGVIYFAFVFGSNSLSILNIVLGLIYPVFWYGLIFKVLGAHVLATHNPRYPFTSKQIANYIKTVRSHPRYQSKSH